MAGQHFSDESGPSPDHNVTLSEREPEVLQAAAHGDCNKEIAYKLGISQRTIKAHLNSIYNKFGVDSRAAAVAIAIAMHKGLLDLKNRFCGTSE